MKKIDELIRDAGPAPELPPEDLAKIRAAARREWQEMSATPIFEEPRSVGQSVSPIFEGPRRARAYFALAATLAIAVASVFVYRAVQAPALGPEIATIELVTGEIQSRAEPVAGRRVSTGDRIETASAGEPARIALRMDSGHSVRLDSGSVLGLDSSHRLVLERGGVYVDSGSTGASRSLEIVTPRGTVREIGTQYEVRVPSEETVRIRVREGSVSLEHEGERHDAQRGEQLVVDALGGAERIEIPIGGPEWEWVTAAAPAPRTEGSSVPEMLAWASRELGLEMAFEGTDATRLEEVEVHGVFSGMTPEQVVGVVLQSAGLDYRIDADRLVVTAAP